MRNLRLIYPRDKEVKSPGTRNLEEIIESAEFTISTLPLEGQRERITQDYRELIEIVDFLIDRVVFTDTERFK